MDCPVHCAVHWPVVYRSLSVVLCSFLSFSIVSHRFLPVPGCHGAAMGLPWGCIGAATWLPWGRHGVAMWPPWDCHVAGTGLPHGCHRAATGVPCGCQGAAKGLPRDCHGPPLGLPRSDTNGRPMATQWYPKGSPHSAGAVRRPPGASLTTVWRPSGHRLATVWDTSRTIWGQSSNHRGCSKQRRRPDPLQKLTWLPTMWVFYAISGGSAALNPLRDRWTGPRLCQTVPRLSPASDQMVARLSPGCRWAAAGLS